MSKSNKTKKNNGTLVFFNPNNSTKLTVDVNTEKEIFTLRTEEYPVTLEGLKMVLDSLKEYRSE